MTLATALVAVLLGAAKILAIQHPQMNAYLAAHPVSTQVAGPDLKAQAQNIKASLLKGDSSSLEFPRASQDLCPVSCSSAGTDPNGWTSYHSINRIGRCEDSVLLNFALFNPLDDPSTHINIQACTADFVQESTTNAMAIPDASCLRSGGSYASANKTLQLASSGSGSRASVSDVDDVVSALEQIRSYFSVSNPGCGETINFASSGQAVVGLYAGAALSGQGILQLVLDQFITYVQSSGIEDTLAVQLCDGSNPRYAMGIIVTLDGTVNGLPAAQNAVQEWKNNTCVLSLDETSAWIEVPMLVPVQAHNGTLTIPANSTASTVQRRASSGTCTTIQVQSGDSCPSLATECGISAANFTAYNPSTAVCSTAGAHVCCSEGTLPDYTPQPLANGYCYDYLIQSGDTCSFIAANYSITVDDINNYNNDTWGWMGCGDLLVGYLICLSPGYAPMPLPVSNAVCGPQVNGTAAAPAGSNLSTLNECPLNACCDIWGQCGTTTEFCTPSNSSTGSPGTAAAGTNGCISNCGTQIITGDMPAAYYNVAYFEGNDWSRPCLNMPVTAVNTSQYTHIHYAFATLNADFSMNISSVQAQWDAFVALQGVKRIISIGGWDFSTDPDTYMIFREAVQPANQDTLINSVVDFLNQYNLDGVDWDWEYPGEPDIPGIPPSTAEDSANFFLFLEQLSLAIESSAPGKTISVTAPSSFWYLQNIPITAISLVVDYIVFMTYDLHGQWDYGNSYSDVGCPAGNCLRSDVNLTDTLNALSMITKAGVPANQVVVGVTSYGRSFQMTTAGCWTADCTYTGGASGALPGPCTDTAGYLANGEIDFILEDNPTAEVYWEEEAYTNVVVYNETQWVGYMNNTNKAVRIQLYEGLTFLGSTDWAVDLNPYNGDESSSSSSSTPTSSCLGYIDPTVWSEATPVVTGMPGCTLVWPPLPLSTTTTISFPPWTTHLIASTWTIVTTTFYNASVTSYPSQLAMTYPTVIQIPPVVTTAIPVWAVTIPSSNTLGNIVVSSSVEPSPFPVTFTPVVGGNTTIVGATTTVTENGTTFIWGSSTSYVPPVTDTFGGSTTVIGGTTLPPVTVTITPHPYPTTVDSTTDPVLNSRSTSWTSGKTIVPSASAGTPGRGTGCVSFCLPDCPVCPPGFGIDINGGGSSGGGGGGDDGGDDGGDGDDNTSSTSSTSSSSSETATETAAGGAQATECNFPLTYEADSALTALSSSIASYWYSQFPTSTSTPTTTTMPMSTTMNPTTTTPTAPATTLGVEGYAVLAEVPYGGMNNFYAALAYTLPNPAPWTCNDLDENDMVMPGNDGLYSYPASWAFSSAIHGYTSCTYTNPHAPSATVGTLTCPDLPSPVDCPVVSPSITGSCVNSGNSLITYVGQFVCHLN